MRRWTVLFLLGFFLFNGIAMAGDAAIVCPQKGLKLPRLAAAEIRRYVYIRTGRLLDIVDTPRDGDMLVVATKDGPNLQSADAAAVAALGPQDYLLKSHDEAGRRTLFIIGGSEISTLWGAYRLAEHLGVRFYMHGDVAPDETIPFALPALDEKRKPLFALRGIQPFHDFPEGPDWWTRDDYKAIIGQLPKLGMNFFGLHTYFGEPEVWIGLPEDINPDGTVKTAYPAAWCMTTVSTGWGFTGKKTSDYALGAGNLFDRDAYGPEVLLGFDAVPQKPEDCIEVFNRTGALFQDAFAWARELGVKTCVGTETPLLPPAPLKERIGPAKDAAFEALGGKIAQYNNPIADTKEEALYQNVRYDLKGYQFPLPEGDYKVTLQFCEVAYSTPGARVFGVAINGNRVIDNLDIFARVGKDKALDITFKDIRPVDGRIAIDFIPQVELPSIAAIAITGPVNVNVNCGGAAYKEYRADAGAGRLAPEAVEKIYEGMFRRLAMLYRPDYYWLWTPETWTWEGVKKETVTAAVDDILTAARALDNIGAPFQLATCGWVLGPQYDRALFDRTLPKSMPISCINRMVGHEPVEKGFADVQGRPTWAIPWLEDDPAMTSPQLWAGRMRRDAEDALAYGCTGLMGIHWRTRILAPNVAALAQAAWEQSWPKPAPAPGTERKDVFAPVDDFYRDYARANFGAAVAEEAAAIFTRMDCHLPQPSDWIGGPGGYKPDPRPWETVNKEYAFVDELEALREKVEGAGNQERFLYWLNTFQYMRRTSEMRCIWAEYDKAMEQVRAAKTPGEQKQLARETVLPLRKKLIAAVSAAYNHLLCTVSSPGEMGTIANLEQHTFPGMLDTPGQELAGLLGEPLPADAVLSRQQSPTTTRLIMPTVRTAVQQGETLNLRAIVSNCSAPGRVTLWWREMGRGDFAAVPMTHVDRSVYAASLPVSTDVEYYIEALGEGDALRWPATAPKLNQTVVVIPNG